HRFGGLLYWGYEDEEERGLGYWCSRRLVYVASFIFGILVQATALISVAIYLFEDTKSETQGYALSLTQAVSLVALVIVSGYFSLQGSKFREVKRSLVGLTSIFAVDMREISDACKRLTI